MRREARRRCLVREVRVEPGNRAEEDELGATRFERGCHRLQLSEELRRRCVVSLSVVKLEAFGNHDGGMRLVDSPKLLMAELVAGGERRAGVVQLLGVDPGRALRETEHDDLPSEVDAERVERR